MNVLPIRPEDIPEKKRKIPDFVIKAFNHHIALNYNDGVSEVLQKDVVKTIKKLSGKNCKPKWLHISSIFSKYWYVTYHNLGYDAPRDPYFLFERK
jgi:hypothetical protein